MPLTLSGHCVLCIAIAAGVRGPRPRPRHCCCHCRRRRSVWLSVTWICALNNVAQSHHTGSVFLFSFIARPALCSPIGAISLDPEALLRNTEVQSHNPSINHFRECPNLRKRQFVLCEGPHRMQHVLFWEHNITKKSTMVCMPESHQPKFTGDCASSIRHGHFFIFMTNAQMQIM